MRLKLGFIGLGAMGLSHLKAFAEQSGAPAEISAVCARNPEHISKALAIAPEAAVMTDEATLLKSSLDAVIIATPNFTHVPLTLRALQSGKHVFLEKPCGITRQGCDALLDASARSDRIVMIGHELRYSPYFRRIGELIGAGRVGVPRMVWTREFRGPFQKKSEDWIEDARRSGGTLVDKNCHHFDMMNWWVGSRPARVSAFGGCAVNRVRADEHQGLDHATVSWEYENGARGTLQLCMFAHDFPREDLDMGVVGDAGIIQTRISSLEIHEWQRGNEQSEPTIHRVDAVHGHGWGGHLGFAEIHQAFIEAIFNGRKPLTVPGECVDGTLLAIAAEESIRSGATTKVGARS